MSEIEPNNPENGAEASDDGSTGTKVQIYNRINRLREKAGGSRHEGGNGQLDRRVLDKAQSAINKYAPEYPDNVERDLDILNAVTQELMEVPEEQQAGVLKRLSKVANDVQSLGTTFGYDLITAFGQSLCRYTDSMQSANSNQMVMIRAHVDTISIVLHRKIKGDGGEEGRLLASELKKALEKHGGEEAGKMLDESMKDIA